MWRIVYRRHRGEQTDSSNDFFLPQIVLTVNFSSRTTSLDIQRNLETNVEKRTKDTYGPPMGKRLLVFMDDMNMPKVVRARGAGRGGRAHGPPSPFCVMSAGRAGFGEPAQETTLLGCSPCGGTLSLLVVLLSVLEAASATELYPARVRSSFRMSRILDDSAVLGHVHTGAMRTDVPQEFLRRFPREGL